MEKGILDKQSLIARKYTVMMNNEPLDLWLKGDKITKAMFMDRKADLSLSADTVRLIKSMPTRLVNGENLKDKEDFVKKTSELMSAQLELAIAKQDMKILSRFARSKLVPEAQKENFMEAINRPRGLRGAITKGLNHAQQMFASLAKRIDNFFDKQKDAIANPKIDKYLKEFQHHEYNKAPKYEDLDLEKHVDPKLQQRANEWVKQHGKECLQEDTITQKAAQEEFLRAATRDGYSVNDAKLALGHVRDNIQAEEFKSLHSQEFLKAHALQEQLNKLQEKYNALEASQQIKIANKTEQDLKIIAADLKAKGLEPSSIVEHIVTNEAYKAASPEQKFEIENRVLYKQEPVQERAQEVRELIDSNSLAKADPKPQVHHERGVQTWQDPDRQKVLVAGEFKKMQNAIKPENKPNQETYNKYHNVAAVKFDGIDVNALKSWARNAQKRGVSEERTNDFIQRSLEHGHVLTNAGIMQKTAEGVYKFKDPAAKACLWTNRDKPLEKLGELNLKQSTGNFKSVSPQQELIERVKMLSSQQSFEKLLDERGNIQPDKLKEYADTLEKASIAMREVANHTTITREDLQRAKEHYHSQAQAQGYGQERA